MSKSNDGGSTICEQCLLILIILGLFSLSLLRHYHRLLAIIQTHKAYLIFCSIGVLVSTLILLFLWNRISELLEKHNPLSKWKFISVGRELKRNHPVLIEEQARLYHTQVIGSTGSGKTEGIIMPWIFDDIENGRGLIIIDGKPELKNLIRLYSKVIDAGRKDDFRLFSLSRPDLSNAFNPFSYGDGSQITEKIFSSFETESSHYKAIQYSAISAVIDLIHRTGNTPKPGVLRELLRDKNLLKSWQNQNTDSALNSDLEKITSLSVEDFQNNFSGILAYLELFSKGKIGTLLNQNLSEINFEDALTKRQIIYFQLPTLSYPTLASGLGRLAIQSIAQAAGELQAKNIGSPEGLFSIYLDDFNDYMYEGFGSVVNKVRSAGIGVVFAHQSLGDLSKVSENFKSVIVENTNNKILLKINDPDSAEFFSSYIGTKRTEKVTERRSRSLLGSQDTGEQSVRETEEFVIHPNTFKTEFGPGDAVAIIQKLNGSRLIQRIKCTPRSDKIPQTLPPVTNHPIVDFIAEAKKYSLSQNKKKSLSLPTSTIQTESLSASEK